MALKASLYHSIKRRGDTLTLRRKAVQSYDPATGQSTRSAEESFAITCKITDYREGDIDGTLVQRGDKKAFIPSLNSETVPVIGDIIDDNDGTSHVVKSIAKVRDKGEVAVYVCHCREGDT